MKELRNEREAVSAMTPSPLSPNVYRGPLRPQPRAVPSLWRRIFHLVFGWTP